VSNSTQGDSSQQSSKKTRDWIKASLPYDRTKKSGINLGYLLAIFHKIFKLYIAMKFQTIIILAVGCKLGSASDSRTSGLRARRIGAQDFEHQPQQRPIMVPVVWNDQNMASIEFCSDGTTFGYRLPGERTCGPAGLLVRVKPGQDYKFTVRNTVQDEPTNVHTHGLHIAGSGNADDVTRFVEPNMCLTYTWSIAEDTMGGTHWLHSHMHELTQKQTAGGAFSMFIVEDNENILDNVKSKKDQENIQKWLDNEILLIAAKIGDSYTGFGSTTPSASSTSTFDMTSDEWYRLRLLTVQQNGKRLPVNFPKECDIHHAASDGVFNFETPELESRHEFFPTGASRMDLAVKCPAGRFTVTAGENMDPVAVFEVENGSPSSASPFLSGFQAWEPVRPYSLRDLSNENIEDFENYEVVLNQRTISGNAWDEEDPAFYKTYDSLQEWTVAGSAAHPFHLHVHHMQTFNCDGHKDGEYYDTIAASNDDCIVRFHVVDYGSRTVMHCHNIGHEDQGMVRIFSRLCGLIDPSSFFPTHRFRSLEFPDGLVRCSRRTSSRGLWSLPACLPGRRMR